MGNCVCRFKDYYFVRGDTLTLNVQYESSNGACPPVYTPIPITGASIYFTCKQYATDADPGLFQLIIGSGIIITDGPNGKFQVIIPEASTLSLNCGVAMPYDCVIKPLAGGRDTVLKGTLTLEQNITGV